MYVNWRVWAAVGREKVGGGGGIGLSVFRDRSRLIGFWQRDGKKFFLLHRPSPAPVPPISAYINTRNLYFLSFFDLVVKLACVPSFQACPPSSFSCGYHTATATTAAAAALGRYLYRYPNSYADQHGTYRAAHTAPIRTLYNSRDRSFFVSGNNKSFSSSYKKTFCLLSQQDNLNF